MFKINLVPEVQEEKVRSQKINSVATFASAGVVAICVITAAIMGGFYVVKNGELEDTKRAIASTEEEVGQFKDLEKTVLSLEQGLAGVKQILDGNNRWTKLLPHLEKATPSDIKFTKLTLSEGKVSADLEGQSVNSLARFVESYKKYKLVAISGKTSNIQTVSIVIDGGASESVQVKLDGTWLYGTNFDPEKDHEITIDLGEGKKASVKYNAKEKKLDANEESITAEVKTVFTNVETKEYSKKGSNVVFSATFDFDKKAIW